MGFTCDVLLMPADTLSAVKTLHLKHDPLHPRTGAWDETDDTDPSPLKRGVFLSTTGPPRLEPTDPETRDPAPRTRETVT